MFKTGTIGVGYLAWVVVPEPSDNRFFAAGPLILPGLYPSL